MSYEVVNNETQWHAMRDVEIDPRPRVRSGFPSLDRLLHRESFGPGTFVLLAGRMHTRKTTVAVNLIRNFLLQGIGTLFVTLDESLPMYTAKLASVITGVPHTDADELEKRETQYRDATSLFCMTKADRPSIDDLTYMLGDAEVLSPDHQTTPRVVVIDYLSLLQRGKYDGSDSARVPRLCEDLQAWSNKAGVVTIALHQVGRQSDNQERVHGDKRVTPEQLMYGGEQQADIILSTYRPALDPIGNLTEEEALADGIDPTEYAEKRNKVQKYEEDTFLQLIKNRPGIHLDTKGIRLHSVEDTQRMEESP